MDNSSGENNLAEKRSKIYWIFNDVWTLSKRSLMHITKNPDQILGLTIQPIMFMILFRYVFGGAINTGPINYVNFLMAGILVQSLAFGSMTTSISVAVDLQSGIIDRFKSLPIFSLAVVLGHVIADFARNIIQGSIMIVVGLLVGFRPEASFGNWLEIIGILLLFTFSLSWIAAILALIAKNFQTVQWLGFFVIFPFTFASAAFAPPETMAPGLREFALNQPVTHVIEAVRALMLGLPVHNHAALSIMWSLIIIAVSIPITTYLFRKHSGK